MIKRTLVILLSFISVFSYALPFGKPKVSTPAISKEERLVSSLVSTMSPRFQKEVHIEDPASFLRDLKAVLSKMEETRDIPLLSLIDKTHSLSSAYVPRGLMSLTPNSRYDITKSTLSLRPEAYRALDVLARASQEEGIKLTVSSTYRSYAYQERTFNYWVSVDGLEEAERESARPGTSQHQAGCAIDFGNIDDSFINTTQGQWLYKNAWKYGWSLSFPKNYEDVTGYRWECWHYRYIGKEACELQRKYFNDVQQYMLEFIDAYTKMEEVQ